MNLRIALRSFGVTIALVALCLVAPAGAQDILFCEGQVVTVDIGQGDTPTSGDDVIRGTASAEMIDGLGGNDTICALGGDDIINGGDGFDRIFAGAGDDVVTAGAGNDRISGGAGADVIFGGSGNDRIWGGGGDDELDGDGGYDRIVGMSGNDILRGGTHGDELFGNLGRDRLFGEGGDDVLRGGAWQDVMNGGLGSDGCTLTDPAGVVEERIECETGVFQATVTRPTNMWDALVASGRASLFVQLGEPFGLGVVLAQTVDGGGQPIERTLFAPNDSAMNTALVIGDPELTDPEVAVTVLGYHLLDASLSLEDLRALDGALIVSETGLPIEISVVDGQVILNGTIRIVGTEISATNGIVHIIDAVLVPPTVNELITLDGVSFNEGSAEITPAAEAELAKALAFLSENSAVDATVAGYTSTDGASADNLVLSRQRAQAVKDFLVDNGIAADRLTVEAFGETQPILVNGSEDPIASNRVEFIVR